MENCLQAQRSLAAYINLEKGVIRSWETATKDTKFLEK